MGALFGGTPYIPPTPRPYVPPKREAPSGPQLAPGQSAAGATVIEETEDQRRRRLLAAKATRDTVLGDSYGWMGEGGDGGNGGPGGGAGPGGSSGAGTGSGAAAP